MPTRGLDLSRLVELEVELGLDVAAIVDMLVDELDDALRRIDAALAAGDLPPAALAAHAARNSALMIDVEPLLVALRGVERAARRPDLSGARRAARTLADDWTALRAELRAATHPVG
ncbi:MAG: hypothetical protein JOZ07_13445 [Solirubrobacterales bacterium]|nr:hypothetical protein [Solirubrobacterales bacterium]